MSMFGAVDLSNLAPAKPAAATGRETGPGRPGPGQAPQPVLGLGVAGDLVVRLDASNLQQVAQTSTQLPVVIVVHTARVEASEQAAELLEQLAAAYAGRFQLALLDADAAPEVAQALQVRAVPTALGLLAGQPVPLFEGPVQEPQLRSLLDRLLELAAANGVDGVLEASAAQQPEEPQETETERAAREAIEAGDLAAAEAVYDRALAQAPGDEQLRVAREQVRLMARLEGQDPQALLAASDVPGAGTEALLAGADAALALGDLDGCLGRGLEAVRTSSAEEREKARKRLLELFDVIGATAPEVARARRTLASLLF
ncbi:tetratricopeptide repeat protein [Actinomyces weissii]|uniref:Tetratricopeptide repeat protein n=1 Tax=Actinomyces weissii TaxID=675090 RepID=A0A7T7M8K5_9ACTO|nr:tetratricopeptide repeat protein [Actinomyces weissii]QQM66896.1 tetratricopeptide repeat protein [Actinomyces weissii]